MINKFHKLFTSDNVLNQKLKKNNITKLTDLFLIKPKKYENYTLSDITKINNSQQIVSVLGTIYNQPKLLKTKKIIIHFKMMLQENLLIEVIIFNRLYLLDMLKPQKIIIVKGKYDINKKIISATIITDNLNLKNTIKPIYNLKDIADKTIIKMMKYILDKNVTEIKENLPLTIIKKHNLMDRREALQNLHLPQNSHQLQSALNRLKYEEAFQMTKKWFEQQQKLPFKEPLKYNIQLIKKIIKAIPFELTPTQKITLNEIYKDFKKNQPTQRLIQGDVGSGKTIIAFLAAVGAITAKKQVLMMVPTEILAQQHYTNFIKMFPKIKTILLSSANKDKQKLKQKIKNNQTQMIIGTHILANIEFFDLALIIIDEQHKFGLAIKYKIIMNNKKADIIYMTATPIPKTLILSNLGNINTSIIKKNIIFEKKVITKKISQDKMLNILNQNQNKKQQTYIIAPAIKKNKKKFNITNMLNYLTKAKMKNLYVLHGKQNKEEQDKLIKNFVNNKCGILLTTTIIEVGLDLQNVNTIVIVGADCFGLSQLHQLRGRVGRNNQQGYCYLIADNKNNERLEILTKESDGFKLSDYDLIKRGPGKFFGLKQSGYFQNKFLSLPKDFKILLQTKKDIEDLNKY